MIDPDDLTDRLKALDSAFKKAPDKPRPSGKFERFKPPEGTYWATVDSVDFLEFYDDVAHLKISFLIAQNEHKGKTIEKIYVLEPHKLDGVDNEEAIRRLGFLRQDLSVLGIDVEQIQLSDVRPGSPIWDDILGRNVELAVRFGRSGKLDKDGDPYRNVYINASTDALGKERSDIPTDDPPVKTTKTDDNIPF